MLTVNSSSLLEKVDRQIEWFAAPASKKSEFILACQRGYTSIFGESRLDCYLGYNYSRLRSMLHSRGKSFLKDSFPDCTGYPRLMGEMTAKAKLKQIENWHKLQQIRLQNTKMIEESFSQRRIVSLAQAAAGKYHTDAISLANI